MAQVIKLKRSAVSGSVPLTSQLELGEVAINTYDGKMFIKKNDGTETIVEIGGFSASATTPAAPTAGQLWYDTTNATLKYYDGAAWTNIIGDDYQSNVITSTSEPTTAPDGSTALAAGDTYFNTSDNTLYVHNGTAWTAIDTNIQIDSDWIVAVIDDKIAAINFDSDWISDVAAVVQANLDSDVGVLNTTISNVQSALQANIDSDLSVVNSSIATIVGGNFIDSDYVLTEIDNAFAAFPIDSDWISAKANSLIVGLVDSDYVLSVIADSEWVLDQIDAKIAEIKFDSDWILSQIPDNKVDSDWVLSQIPDNKVDSDWVGREIDGKIGALDLTYVDSDFQAVSYLETTATGTALDCKTANLFSHTTTANTTFTFTNPPASGIAYGFTLVLTAGGTHTITWPAATVWAGGTAPDAPASGETDVLTFFTLDGGTTWYGARAIDAAA
jgi:hypothetical protein